MQQAGLARLICSGLEALGIRTYCFLERPQESLGVSLVAEFQRVFPTCEVVVALVDKNFWNSDYCLLEMRLVRESLRQGRPMRLILVELRPISRTMLESLGIDERFIERLKAPLADEDCADACIDLVVKLRRAIA